jgi:hypothetical protein
MSDKYDRQVDDALRTYPLKPVPTTLAPRVAIRLRALAPAPRFRLMWTDYALSLFAAGMLGLALLGWQVLTPQLLLKLQWQTLMIVQQVGIIGGVAMVGGLALAVGACGLAALILAQPIQQTRRL